jgi:cysteine protease ATG4
VRGGFMSPDFGFGLAHGQSPMTENELFIRPRSGAPDLDAARQPAGGTLTPAEDQFYARPYAAAGLRTFHYERLRKMPMSGLDPSMLIGFCMGRRGVGGFKRCVVYHICIEIVLMQSTANTPPTWPGADDDDDMGLESISDPEEVADVGFDDGDV